MIPAANCVENKLLRKYSREDQVGKVSGTVNMPKKRFNSNNDILIAVLHTKH